MFAALQIKSAAVVLTALSGTDASPNNTLPGGDVLKNFVGGLMTYALYGAVMGLLIGGGLWMFGSKSNNHQQASSGKTMVFAALGFAFLVGAANQLGVSFQQMGSQVK